MEQATKDDTIGPINISINNVKLKRRLKPASVKIRYEVSRNKNRDTVMSSV